MPLLRSRAPLSHYATAAGLYAFFAVFLIWPLAQIVRTGFVDPRTGTLTLRYLGLIFQDPTLVRGLVNATLVAVAVTVATAAVSLPLALISVRYDFPGRNLLTGLLLLPLVLPPFVGALGMRLVLGRYGPLTHLLGAASGLGIDWLGGHFRLTGIVLVESLGLYPIMLLNLQAALANIDPAMEQAAANLGAGPFTILRRITWPLMRPGLLAGATLVLIWSFTELGTPLIFDYQAITPVQVFSRLTDVGQDNPLPYALVVVMMLASAALYIAGRGLLRGGVGSTSTSKATVRATRIRLTGFRAALATIPFILVIAAAVLPHLAVVLTSLSATGAWYKSVLPAHLTAAHYISALRDPLAMSSITNSITYAAAATALALALGLATAILVTRSTIPGKRLLDALAMLPLAVPGIVLAFGYLAVSIYFKGKFPTATQPNHALAFLNVQESPAVLLVLAYAARRLPYVLRSAVAGLEQTPVDLELAASNLGARRTTVLRRITIPLIAANLLAGALLAFAFAMLEVSDSIILAQRSAYYPITKAILELSQRLGDGLYVASSLGVWAMVLLTLTLLTANALLGKKLGALFRM